MDLVTLQLIFLPIVIGFWIVSNWLMTATSDPAYADNSIWRQSDARIFTAGCWLALNLVEILAVGTGGTFSENLAEIWMWTAVVVVLVASLRVILNAKKKKNYV